MQLFGFHHLTAITADAPANHAFYTGTLGLRLVKKTVNQDDPSAYHLFYADSRGSPGTDITFFDWTLGRERRGSHSIVRTAFRVPSPGSLDYWSARLKTSGAKASPITTRDSRPTLDFEDPEGQRLSLVTDDDDAPAHPWSHSPVPAEHQLRGLGPITLSVPSLPPTGALLTQLMNMRPIRQYASTLSTGADTPTAVHVYEMSAGGGPAAELHVAIEPSLPPARQGAGAVHHVAFRTPNVDEYNQWIDRLRTARIPFSGPVDRFYFKSLYFREPSGILFEIATDGPGFHADEPLDQLGQRLSLPPFLEHRRAEIEAGLRPLPTGSPS